MKSLRIALAGTGRLGVCLFKGIADTPHEIVAVIQNGRTNKGWSKAGNWLSDALFPNSLSMTSQARRRRIPVFYIDTMDEFELAPIRQTRPDLLVVGGFSIILKRPLLDLPAMGCINTHSSLLPRHRGPNPFTAAILAGDTESGVTFHVMTERIDDGDIVMQVRMPIDDRDDSGSVYRKSCELAGEHVGEMLEKVACDGLTGTPQDGSIATYDKKLRPEQCVIDWTRPSVDVERLVRACFPLSPLARFVYQGQTVYVTRVRINADARREPGTVISNQGRATITTGDGSVTLLRAFTNAPVPWIWPAPWNRPRIGDRLV